MLAGSGIVLSYPPNLVKRGVSAFPGPVHLIKERAGQLGIAIFRTAGPTSQQFTAAMGS
jgi:hypothetical protein